MLGVDSECVYSALTENREYSYWKRSAFSLWSYMGPTPSSSPKLTMPPLFPSLLLFLLSIEQEHIRLYPIAGGAVVDMVFFPCIVLWSRSWELVGLSILGWIKISAVLNMWWRGGGEDSELKSRRKPGCRKPEIKWKLSCWYSRRGGSRVSDVLGFANCFYKSIVLQAVLKRMSA